MNRVPIKRWASPSAPVLGAPLPRRDPARTAGHAGGDDGMLDSEELRERHPEAAHAAHTRDARSRLRPRDQLTMRKPAPITAIPATASSTKWFPVTRIVTITSGG